MELVVNVTSGLVSWNDRVCTGLVRRPLCKLREWAAAYESYIGLDGRRCFCLGGPGG